MKKIQFRTIEITNFLSVGKTQCVEFSDGITAIFGINHDKANDSNGVGKSTILSAVCFALYGDPIKNIKRDEVVNRIAGSKCEVSLTFDVSENGTTTEYRIERGVKPSFCRLYRGDEDISLSGMPETTKLLGEILGTSAVMFKNTCLMSLEDNIPFARQKAAEKREFIEGVFDLGFIKDMAKAAKANSDKLIAENTEANSHIDEINNQIELYNKGEADFEANKKAQIEEGLRALVDLKKKKEELSSELVPIDKNEAEKINEEVKAQESAEEELSKQERKLNDDRTEIIKEGTEVKGRIAEEKRRDEEHEKYLTEIEDKAKSYGIDDYKEFISPDTVKAIDDKIAKIEELLKKIGTRKPMIMADILRDKRSVDELMEKGNICLACGRPFPENDIAARDKKVADLKKSMADNEILLEKAKSAEAKATEDLLSIRSNRSKWETLTNMLEHYNSYKKVDISELEGKLVELRSRVVKNKVDLDGLVDKKKALSEKKDEIYEKRAKMRERIAEYETKRKHVETIEEQIEKTVSSVKEIKDSANKFTEYKKEAEAKLSEWEKKRDDTEHLCSVYRTVREILSDDGFKSYMVKQYINVLNGQINKYLTKLDAPIRLEFDEYLDDKITDQMTGTVCSYDSLSGGEKRRVDIACLLSFSDLRRLRGDVLFSHAFYDEILDSALSPGACGKLMSILKDRFDEDGESSMIITHKQEMQDDPNIKHKILVEKIGGVSKLSDG